jgi:hypothetical protein
MQDVGAEDHAGTQVPRQRLGLVVQVSPRLSCSDIDNTRSGAPSSLPQGGL